MPPWPDSVDSDNTPFRTSQVGVFCLGRNVTVRPLSYVLGHQETDVDHEAFPSSLLYREEGGPLAAASCREGARLQDLRGGEATAIRVLRVVAPSVYQPRRRACAQRGERNEQARERACGAQPRARGQA